VALLFYGTLIKSENCGMIYDYFVSLLIIQFINETWPGMMENSMRIFSLYLEQVLLASY
jgi:hypothetical protein